MAVRAKDIAQELGLSEAAVSLALNSKPGVSTATRQRVLETAQRMGFDLSRLRDPVEPHTEQGTLIFAICKKHGAVVSDTPFFSELAAGIEQACRQLRYSLSVRYLHGDESIEKQLRALPFCNGMLLLGTELRPEDFEPFLNLHLPLVVVDTYFDTLPCDFVLVNNFQGAYEAASYLLRKTKAQPGYLRSSYRISNFDRRADGFYQAIRDAGASPSKSQALSLSPSAEGAYEDMRELLRAGEIPARAYFADNDLIAAGALRALREAGYRVPQDVAIAGFDDLPLCVYVDPPLTTIHVPKQYMGQTAVRRLDRILREKQSYPAKIEIATALVKRRSV